MTNRDDVIRIRGARIIDPFRGIDVKDDELHVAGGRIVSRDDVRDGSRPVRVVDAHGLWLVPRLTDMHVHLRSPGQEWKEDLVSGSQAAAAGGFTIVAPMGNTDPPVDIPSLVEWQRHRGDAIGLVRIFPIGTITHGLQGERLADLYTLEQAGAVGFSDDGRVVASARLMRAALSYSVSLRHPIIEHAEDRALAEGTVMHEGDVSQRLGLPGVPEQAEALIAWRDVELAGLTGGRLHLAHVSSLGTLAALAYAKRSGLTVSAEVTPHHLYLTDEAVEAWDYNPVTKVNPPLRPQSIRQALIEAVVSGLVPVIASDHAPHHADEKAQPYSAAPYGISGLETSLGTVLTVLLHSGRMNPVDLFARLSKGPDQVMGLNYPGLLTGAEADLTLIDPNARWTVDPARFYSKGHNTPMAGEQLTGRAVATMCRGRWTMRDGEVLEADGE
ncbi:MAG: dihydroorotase [Thermaerobacter sp.]|nr:dihydroorotase [Thermaerobacter sp.]